MAWTVARNEEAFDRAMKLARGCYQRNLLLGWESLSGSTLKGRAARYRGRYQASAANLLARMSAAGISWAETSGSHGKRVLEIG